MSIYGLLVICPWLLLPAIFFPDESQCFAVTVKPLLSDRFREMSKVVSQRGGLLRRVWGLNEVMKKQRMSNNDQVLLRLLCLAAFVEISSLIF